MNPISNSDDIIDSRDVIARIDELMSERSGLETDRDDAHEAFEQAAGSAYGGTTEQEIELGGLHDLESALLAAASAVSEWDDSEDSQELRTLQALQEGAEGYCDDWKYGAQLIRDSHFKDYAQEFADDIGAVPRDVSWPMTCIDWDQAADELKQDYTSVEFDGVTYWVR